MGYTPAQITQALGEPEADGPRIFEVEPENGEPVALFSRLRTQWRKESIVAGKVLLVRYHGLDYAAVPGVAAGLRIDLTETVWDALRLMEGEALRIYARREEEALRRP